MIKKKPQTHDRLVVFFDSAHDPHINLGTERYQDKPSNHSENRKIDDLSSRGIHDVFLVGFII